MSESIPKKWLAIDVETGADAAEAVEYALNALDALGTEIDSLRKSPGENLRITGYFNAMPDTELLRREIDLGLKIYDQPEETVYTITARDVPDADWLAEWKRHWKPTDVGKFIIAPPWSVVAETDKIVIRIEPNMAFGTGTHETTQLCLTAIGEIYGDGQSFLDVGTGTGILAIAVAKLATENTEKDEKILENSFLNSVSSVAKILACDTDRDSVKIATENAKLNGVGGRIEFFEGSISDATPQIDFVCANLTIDVIVPILPQLIAKTKRVLLLSGILAEQEKVIVDELIKFQISNYEIAHAGEWISVLIRFN